jgi:hypothetical protein
MRYCSGWPVTFSPGFVALHILIGTHERYFHSLVTTHAAFCNAAGNRTRPAQSCIAWDMQRSEAPQQAAMKRGNRSSIAELTPNISRIELIVLAAPHAAIGCGS